MFEHRNDESRNISVYLQNPSTSIHSVEDAARQDRWISEYISRMEQEIKLMQEFRQINFQRMQQIFASPWQMKILLKRERHYDGKVFYFLQEWKVYEDSTIRPQQLSSQKYPGTDRHKAIADFKAYQKSHPGILAEMDIEKSKWER